MSYQDDILVGNDMKHVSWFLASGKADKGWEVKGEGRLGTSAMGVSLDKYTIIR